MTFNHPTDSVPTLEAMREARLRALDVLVRRNRPLVWRIARDVGVTTDELGNPKGIISYDLPI